MKRRLIIVGMAILVSGAAVSEPTDNNSPLILTSLRLRLMEIVSDARATIRIEGNQLILEQNTRSYLVYRSDKTGKISREPTNEIGPDSDGLLLSIAVQDGVYAGAAETNLEIKEPYWTTYFDAYAIDKGARHLHVNLSYGTRTDRQLIERIKKMLEATKDGEPR
ncbi:MAG: hypothetical protein HY343_01240 [Lentisphaerae bacterium]|nr:hypothetical protein [Lentisphaerota bacterium]